MRVGAAALSLVMLAACSPYAHQLVRADETQPPQRVEGSLGPPSRWLCEDGRTLTATFYENPPRVDIQVTDGTHRTLPQAPSASGVLYEGDTLRFHMKSNEAYFAEGEHVTNCEESPKE